MSIHSDLMEQAAHPAPRRAQGEAVTFDPGDGTSNRTVTCLVERHDAGEQEVAVITCLDDASDATYGGVTEPHERDRILLDGDTDLMFAWTRSNRDDERPAKVHNTWRIVFRRDKPGMLG